MKISLNLENAGILNSNLKNNVKEGKVSFMMADIAVVIMNEIPDYEHVQIIELGEYYSESKEKEKNIISKICELAKQENFVLITTAYVSKQEFPPEKYYMYKHEACDGKEKIPFDEVIERESKIVESLDFKNINKLIRYESSEPYLYIGNDIGKKLYDILVAREFI